MSRISELNDELQAVRDQKAYLIRHGAENTDQRIVDSEEREAELFRKISEEESRVANEEIAEDIRTSDKPFVLTVGGVDINLRDYIPTEENYQVVAIALSQKLHEVNTAHNAATTDLTNRFEIERQQYRDQITNADAAADAKYNELYEQFHDTKNERDDFERKLQAAASEIDSLKQQLEVASTKVEAPKPTNLDGNLAEAMRKANEAKRAIYDVVNDSANINYTAKFVDNDETFTDKLIYIGKYRQMSNEEAQRFQQEAEQDKQTELESTPEAEITPEPVEDTFRPNLPAPDLSNVDAGNEVVGDESLPESDENSPSGSVTRAELENRLRQIKEEVKAEIVYEFGLQRAQNVA